MAKKNVVTIMTINLILICFLLVGCGSKKFIVSIPELCIPMSGSDLPEINYSIELKDLEKLPQTANIYEFISEQPDAISEVVQIAKLFDISVDATDIQYYDDYLTYDNGSFLIDYEIPTSMWSIRNMSEKTDKSNELPSDEEAITIARNFLVEKELYDERFSIESVVTQYSGSELDSTYSPSFKTVYFYPTIDNYPILGVSRIIVKIDTNGQVAELMRYYKDFELAGVIELSSPLEFIEGIKSNAYSTNISPDAVSARITDVKLRYWEDAGSFEEQPYLQPVWVFWGESTQADGTVEEFDVVVQAAKNKN